MKCPRCDNELKEPLHINALSRHKEEYVCSDCHLEEALDDYLAGVERRVRAIKRSIRRGDTE